MSRLKRPAPPATPPAGIPSELFDRRHDYWRENESADYWRTINGLPRTVPITIRAQPMPHDPPGVNFGKGGRIRHHRAVSDWARANGYTRHDRPGWVDWHRLRDVGLLTPTSDGRVS